MSTRRHLLDVRWRKAIVESLYVEHLHTTVRFLLSQPDDYDTLLNYIEDSVHDPLSLASDINAQNLRLWYESKMNQWLQQQFTIIVTDCFEVFGLAAAQVVQNSKVHTSLDIDLDYGDIHFLGIAQAHAPSEEGKFMRAFIDELHSKTPNFLPDDCSEFLQIEMFNVNQDYQGAGVGNRLLKEMLKLAKSANVKFVSIACTSDSMRKLAERLKFESKFSLPYNKFICNGEPVFGEAMHDGTSAAHLMVGDVDQMEQILKDEEPSLPNAYRLPKTERRLLSEVKVPRLQTPLRYEIAVPEDEPVIRDFMTNEYYRQTNIPRTLQCRKEDGSELMTRFRPETIQDGLVILAIHEGKLCAISVNRGVVVQKGPDYKPKSKEDICIPDDFTSLIDAQPLTHIGGKTVRAINAWMESHVPDLMPADCDRFFMLNMLAVHPDYRGCGIANKIWFEAMKLGLEKGHRYVQCMCSAAGSCKAAENIGLKMVISLPYSKVTYNGSQLFPDGQVNDGGRVFNMYVGQLDQILEQN